MKDKGKQGNKHRDRQTETEKCRNRDRQIKRNSEKDINSGAYGQRG